MKGLELNLKLSNISFFFNEKKKRDCKKRTTSGLKREVPGAYACVRMRTHVHTHVRSVRTHVRTHVIRVRTHVRTVHTHGMRMHTYARA